MGVGHGDWELGGRVKRMKVVEQLRRRYIVLVYILCFNMYLHTISCIAYNLAILKKFRLYYCAE